MSATQVETTINLTEEEAEKLHCFQNTVDVKTQRRFRALRRHLEQEQLTHEEHQELMELTNTLEGINVARLEFLAEVGSRRGLPLADVMRLLSIHSLLS